MQRANFRISAIVCCAISVAAVAKAPAAEPAASSAGIATFEPEQLEFFEKQVRPLLVKNCHRCHGDAAEPKGGLRLLSRDAALAGGDSGPAIAPGKPDESLLIQAVRYGPDSYQMPPQGKLSDSEIAALEKWVAGGATWPAETVSSDTSAHVAPDPKSAFDLQARRQSHWAWQPIREVNPPEVARQDWPRSAIDRFILARLEQAGLEPAAVADRAALIRRVTFDLTGLPPTLAEIEAFLADGGPDAYERVVERLLASPQYGERWARHWLDLVRFAETHGHEFDYDIENAWQYRDYVIRAFNADVPYHQFLTEHVAGDLVNPPRRHPSKGFNESIIGTGFFHFGEATHSPVDIRGDEADRIDNQIDVLSKTFLGLTVSCARCHDHKFDAISTKDYYALVGFLRSSHYQQAFLDPPELNAVPIAALSSLYERRRPTAIEVARLGARPTIEQLERVLQAAHNILASGEKTLDERVAQAAKQHSLAADLLRPWVAHLQSAATTPADPFHAWSVLATDSSLTSPEQFSAACHALAARLAPQSVRSENVFATFSSPDYAGWSATGDAFGAGPTRGGELLFGAEAARPVTTVLAPGIAHSGRISGKLRGVIRSQTFDIRHKRIAYRAAGRGMIRLVVDSHRVIFGPLHGTLNHKIESGERLAWHVQNVEEYLGHRGHIELVDEGDGHLAVDEILFADGDLPSEPTNASVLSMLGQSHLGSVQQLGAEYQRLLTNALERGFDAGEETSGPRDLLNWLLAHPALFPVTISAEPAVAQSAAQLADQQKLEAELRISRRAPAMADGSGEDMAVHIRGNHKQLGDPVPRRFLEAIAGADQPPIPKGSGRLELADRMIAPTNPLVPRVIVNRLWLHHFGEGIVPSPDDFGVMGQPPTHPELLDFLAAEFVRGGWSIKSMHRALVLSSTYRMSSRPSAASLERDPENKLLQHMRVRRIEAEAVRDAILAVSGGLDPTMFGPSVPVYLTEFMVGRGRPKDSGPLDGAGRRSIYLSVRRNFMTPLMVAFDFPQPSTTMGQRNVSNVPAQGLALMNDPFVVEQAVRWGTKALESIDKTVAYRISDLYWTAFARGPSAAELTAAAEFVATQQARYADASRPADPFGRTAEHRAWSDLCHALYSAKEFIFIE